MHPDIMQMISVERNREMRERAAAWRSAREPRSDVQAQSARIRLALIARLARSPLSQPGHTRLRDQAAA